MSDWPATPISFQQNPYGGPITLDYLFSTATSNADPGSGYFALNNATENTATALYIDITSFDGVAAAGVLDNLTNSSNTNKALLRIVGKTDTTKFLLFYITAWITHTGYRELTISIVASSAASPFASGDECLLMAGQIGDKGTGITSARVATQFDKTTDTTLANIPGLSLTLTAGRTYQFIATLHVSPDAVGGQKYAIAGTCTATAIIYQVNTINNTTNANIINSRQTALGGSIGVAGGTSDFTMIIGTITVNAGGTLTVQFAENASSGTSSVLIGSTLVITDIT